MLDDAIDASDPERWLAALRAAYACSLSDGAAFWRRAQQAIDRGEQPATAIARAAIRGLETMGASDPTSFGMSACDALRLYGGAEELERLRATRDTLPARKGLRDWRVETGRALSVMAARVAGECTCAAEAAHGAPVYGDMWRVESEEIDRDQYCVRMRVRCQRCQSRWLVRRDDGYHYPTFAWSKG